MISPFSRARLSHLDTCLRAAALGAIAGSRSMLAPALVSRALGRSKASRAWSLLAALELFADKTSKISSRTAPLPLLGRALMGGIVGFQVAASLSHRRGPLDSPAAGALVGTASAVASAYALAYARMLLAKQLRSNLAAGLVEDLAAILAGRAIAARLDPAIRT
jgi:uncharacterized membrane protein